MSVQEKSIADACDSWLKSCRRNELERSTLKAYRSHTRVHIEPRIGSLLLTELTRGVVREFLDDLQDNGVSHAQVRKIMVSLRSILSEAVEREWIATNVAVEVKVKRKARARADERIVPTKDEIRLIIENAPESHRAMFITAIFTGMRISELRGLTWDAVDFDRNIVRVLQRADEFNEIGYPKSRAGIRDIPMAPIVSATLKAWIRKVPQSELNLVFPNSVGKVQNYSNIYNRIFKPMLVKNGIVDGNAKARFGIHALRHAAASLFIEQGWNPKKVQTLLGHASIMMTMDVYGHLFENPEEDVSMFEKLERDLLAA
ncbi:tyrosine-type recombinase/integrase [Boseongicola aestuarii]|uniref:Transposase from transposon Tn916 n=1 Tax=Boseongicola aestuarii TaxID=1470561 RepID=A0A238J3N8_9RHOB|nr:site-specific integrase [Boseongicola aestuarii]SMX25298.1 Transposase from transposon Tn916 [Boseongicola aestuarii]